MVGLMVNSLYGKVNGELQEGLCQRGPSSAPVHEVSPCHPTPPQEGLQHQQVVLVQSLGSHCFSPLGLGACKILFVPSKTSVSVFCQFSGRPVIKSRWPLQTIPWGFPVLLSDPQAGKPDVGFRTFTTVQELLWCYCSQSVGSPGGYGI